MQNSWNFDENQNKWPENNNIRTLYTKAIIIFACSDNFFECIDILCIEIKQFNIFLENEAEFACETFVNICVWGRLMSQNLTKNQKFPNHSKLVLEYSGVWFW